MAVVARPGDPTGQPRRPDASAGRDATRWLLGAIIALGVLVRFTTLNEQSFWYDESATWAIVAHGLAHVFSTVPQTESTPPLYYVLLWLWSRVFGTGEVGLRSFSALCSTLTIPVMWMIGRRLLSERAGLIAALLTAVNPFLFWYAQEARVYSLLLLLSAITVLTLVHVLEAPSRGRVLLWGLSAGLALAAHYYAAVLIASEAAWLGWSLYRRRRLTVERAMLGLAPSIIVGAALIPLLVEQNNGRANYIATQEGSLPHRVAQLAKEDIIGQGQPAKVLLTVLGCGLVAIALWLLVRRSRRSERAAGVMLATVGVGGVLVAVVVAAVGTDYFDTRNLIATWPALGLLVAGGLGAARARRIAGWVTAGLVVLSLICVWNIIANPAYQRPNWRDAARALGPADGPRAIVSDVNSRTELGPYLSDLHVFPVAGGRVREIDIVWLQRATQWGPIAPIAPMPLAGFPSVTVTRTSTYVIVRYRAATPQLTSRASLDRIYPIPVSEAALLQDG